MSIPEAKQRLVLGTPVKNTAQTVLKHVPSHSLQPFLLFVVKTNTQFVQRIVQFRSAFKQGDNAGAAVRYHDS